ncbi:MAG: NAD(P)/FAD-dependent oxidoreductase [Acidobacteriia bacterium]|nr:NAD(P)/FAD-dependent oxidoreductase [Terriglobia bacterium]
MTPMTRREFVKGATLAPLALTSLPTMGQQTPRAAGDRFDIVVAGAGHNSLVCAAYLAKAGYKVVVLEGRPTIGGGCKTQEVCLPGFKEDLCSSVHGAFRTNPAFRELSLSDYGLEYIDPDPVMHIPFQDGASITVWRDLDRTCETIARISKKDAETFRRVFPEYRKNLAERDGQNERGAGPRVASYWQRLSAMSGYDAVRVLFESDHMRAASLSTGHFGGVPGGDIGTGAQVFSLMGEVLTGRPIPKGGSGMLTVALGRFIEAHNGVILTNKPVGRLIVEGGKCVGVECGDGSQYRAEKAVVSTIHLKHVVNMAPRELWGDEFLRDLDAFQPEQAMFSFHYATKEPPKYPLPGGGTLSCDEAAIMEHPETVLLMNSYNARGELYLDDIPLQIVSPSVGDPSRAPAGCATVKIEGTLPYALKEGPGHWDNIKDQVADTLFGRLRRAAPNLTPDKILAKFLESPLDIERMNPAMWRGSAHHGDRRIPQFVSYKMPISGLYQTGACTPPGGSITGLPGRNAAAVLLKDLGTSIEEVGKGSKKDA